jgi:hypothetical protein
MGWTEIIWPRVDQLGVADTVCDCEFERTIGSANNVVLIRPIHHRARSECCTYSNITIAD